LFYYSFIYLFHLLITGTVDAYLWSQNFGSIRIGPFTEVIDCGGAAKLQYRRRPTPQQQRQQQQQQRQGKEEQAAGQGREGRWWL